MTHRVGFTEEARDDIKRLYAFALESSGGDWMLAERGANAIETGLRVLETTPFAGKKATDNPLERELVIGFGGAGYVALYEIEDGETVAVLAVRHQREDDYH